MAERTVHLIDTPGLNDSLRSDAETFQELAYWLAAAHENKLKLSGIVYLHRITDTRLQGSAHRSLKMFKAMCGPQAFQGVIVATTMWDELVGDEIQKAHARQVQLKAKIHDDVIIGGGRLVALSAGAVDIRKIVRHTVAKDARITLAFQTEHVDRGLPIHMTGAGRVVYDHLCMSLDVDKPSASGAYRNTAEGIEALRATFEEVHTAWVARIREEDHALDRIQQLFAEHVSKGHLTCRCASLIETHATAVDSQYSPAESTTSVPPVDQLRQAQVDGWSEVDSGCESLRLQQEGVLYRRAHRLDRRRMTYGRTTTIGVVGTGLAVAQLAAAVACNVM